MRYLIDGYNLLHAIGLARKSGGRGAWDRARQQLLDWLADQLCELASDVTVAFDAQKAVGGIIEERHRGLHIVRDRGRSADELIEDMLRAELSPETLIVVSSDGRVRDAAKRHRAVANTCGEFLDNLLRVPRANDPITTVDAKDEKDVHPTSKELVQWLEAFGPDPVADK